MSDTTINPDEKRYAKITTIESSSGLSFPNIAEVWEYRDYMLMVVIRNFTVAYRQTIGGMFYAVYEPLMNMIGYSFLLGGLAQMPSEGIPYPVYAFSALLIWGVFTSAVSGSSNSLVGNSGILQKIYIPRLIFPLTAILNNLVNQIIPIIILALLMLFYGVVPTINIVFLPIYLLITVMFGLGIGLMLGGFYAWFRDTRYVVGLLTRGMFFITPVVYSPEVYAAPFDTLYLLNPMAVVIDAFRSAILGVGTMPSIGVTLYAIVVSFIMLIIGMLVFKKLEATFVDIV